MQFRRICALSGAIAALAAIPGSALAAGTGVSVRIEGLKKTLLARNSVHTHGRSITKGGAPAGTCPATSAAGALNVATRGDWGGTYSQSLGQIELTSIMGESWPFSQPNYYWGVWINNRYATTGMCEINLHRGDRILFAVDSVKQHEHPLAVSAPARATVDRAFTVKVVWYSDVGKAKPLKGVRIDGVTTNRGGIARLTPKDAGKLRLEASQRGYIRSAAQWVRVSG
jgi:hypothetical protein